MPSTVVNAADNPPRTHDNADADHGQPDVKRDHPLPELAMPDHPVRVGSTQVRSDEDEGQQQVPG